MHITIYPSQTKIWEGLTKDEIRIFEAVFKGVSTRFGLRTIEKYIENLEFLFCPSFPNLRLRSIQLKKGWHARSLTRSQHGWHQWHARSFTRSTNTSTCYHHLVSLKLSSTVTSYVCSTYTSQLKKGWHARSLTRLASVACTLFNTAGISGMHALSHVRLTHRHAIIIL
jgi:hypothetical protein